MKRCSQCGKNAMYEIESGQLLCLDCYYKYHSIQQQELTNLLAQSNNLIEHMEASVGLSGVIPKYQLPQPASVINHTLNFYGSVGAVNEGYIENLTINMSELGRNGNEELAIQLRSFMDKLLREESITDEVKNDVLEQLDFITNQLAGKEQPKRSVIKSILKFIPTLISSSESLINIWNMVSSSISNFL